MLIYKYLCKKSFSLPAGFGRKIFICQHLEFFYRLVGIVAKMSNFAMGFIKNLLTNQ